MRYFAKKTFKFPNSNLTLLGYSRSAQATCFFIPELAWALDAGFSFFKDVKYVFVTHGHLDHSFCLPNIVDPGGKLMTNIFVPPGTSHFFEDFINNSFRMNDALDEAYPRHFSITIADTNVVHEIGGNNRYVMKVVNCVHSVPCVGYCFYEKKSKLKQEFKSLSGKEIAQLRKSGVEVSDIVDFPMCAYLGDTTTEVFEKNPELFSFPVIITECTFLIENHSGEAGSRGHTHWGSLLPIVEKHPEIIFILIHFSLRYTNTEILKFFAQYSLSNVVVWVDPDE